MVNNLKLSIIVLTHSGNDTLYQCLYSIKNQTFKKFKCIIIGYDITDACQTIARTICKQDNRFSYIPINSKSLCYAKNLGISLACNDYTMFIQDNDFLQQDCFEKAVFFIRKYNPQILWTASIQYTSDNYHSNINTHINGMYHINDMPFALAERCYIYDKIYQTSLLKNIRFIETEQEQISNIMFNHDCLLQTSRVVNINYRLIHHYVIKNECNINDGSKTKLIQYIDKVNDDNIKKSIELIIQYNFNNKLNNELNIDDLKFDNTPLKVALCAIAKNENLYIREWVEWYKNIGISKIFLYDNNELDGERFEEVINDYIKSGFVEVINKRGITITTNTDQDGQTLQGLIYQDCYDNHYNEFDWICFFDIDEFLEMSKNYNLYTFLNLFTDNPCDGIHIQWRMYGDNNLLYYDNRSVMERFYNKKNECSSTLVKTILKGKKHYKPNILFCAHGPLKISGKYKQIDIINADFSQAFNPYRNIHKLKENMPAYLNHFYCKSTEEFINRKWKKTSAVTGINMNRNYNIKFLMEQYFKYTRQTDAKIQLFNNLINKKQHVEKNDKNDKIIVNFTTWKKRDRYVPLLLKYFKNQTLYPDEIICWLSDDEYHGIIPQSIQYCLNNNLLTQVKFVKGNTFGHKRYETFKYNLNSYNILIDDDIYYPIDYVEKLYNECKKNPNNVICYYSRHEIYKYNGVRSFIDADKNASFGNRYFSGLAIFPPNLFPIESFKYASIRDKYCKKCDDSWINGWLFKKNIKIRAIKNWGKHSPLNVIGSTQEDGIYETHNGLKINGIIQAAINIANAIAITNTQHIAKQLWPEFNINEITTFNKI